MVPSISDFILLVRNRVYTKKKQLLFGVSMNKKTTKTPKESTKKEQQKISNEDLNKVSGGRRQDGGLRNIYKNKGRNV